MENANECGRSIRYLNVFRSRIAHLDIRRRDRSGRAIHGVLACRLSSPDE